MPRLSALLLVLVLVLAACGGGDDGNAGSAPASTQGGGASSAANEYPQEAVDNFLESCQDQPGASAPLCRCSLDRIRERFTFEEFTEAEQALTRGEASGIDFASIAQRCQSEQG